PRGRFPLRGTAASLLANAIALATDPCLSPAVLLPAAPSAIPVPARPPFSCGRRSAGFSLEGRPPSHVPYLVQCTLECAVDRYGRSRAPLRFSIGMGGFSGTPAVTYLCRPADCFSNSC